MPEATAAVPGMDAGATGANDCGGGVNAVAGSAWSGASFIPAAKGDPKGIAGAGACMAGGTAVCSWDFGVNKPVIDACGTAGAGLTATEVKGDEPAGGVNAVPELEKGDAACWGGTPPVVLPPSEKGEAGGAPEFCGCGAAADIMAKGLAAGASAVGLMENGDDAGTCSGSAPAKLGDAAAKGLIGNA